MQIKLVNNLNSLMIAKGIVESEWPWQEKITTEDEIHAYDVLNNKDIYVAILYNNEGIAVGTGSLYSFATMRCNWVGFSQIENVVILSKHRGLGYGQALIDYLVKIALNNSSYKIVLNCVDDNIPFYEKCGFTYNGNQMRLDAYQL